MKAIHICDIEKLVQRMCELAIENEAAFCELDAACGDGDFGTSLAKGFSAVLKSSDSIPRNSIKDFLIKCGMLISEHSGGTTGPIWGSAFIYAGRSVGEKNELNLADIYQMLEKAVEGIQKTGGAKQGDKTVLDALIPAVKALGERCNDGIEMREALKICAEAAVQGAEKTKEMIATKGRASYLGERSIGHPDAGATAVGILLQGLSATEN